jgi:hypothetical protein
MPRYATLMSASLFSLFLRLPRLPMPLYFRCLPPQRESMLPRPLMRRCLRFSADAAADAVFRRRLPAGYSHADLRLMLMPPLLMRRH